MAATTNTVADTLGISGDVGEYMDYDLNGFGYPVIAMSTGSGNRGLWLAVCDDDECATSTLNQINYYDPARYINIELKAGNLPVIAYNHQWDGNLEFRICTDTLCNTGTLFVEPATEGKDLSMTLAGGTVPVMSSWNQAGGTMTLTRCTDAACGTINTNDVGTGGAAINGRYTAVQLDGAGNPIIAFVDAATSALKVAHCNDAFCTGLDESIVTLDAGTGVPITDAGAANPPRTDMVLDGAGNPIIAFVSGNTLHVAHCNDTSCTTFTETAIAGAGTGVTKPSIDLDPSGNPVISYISGGNLMLAQCTTTDCSGTPNVLTLLGSAGTNANTMFLNNLMEPLIAFQNSANDDAMFYHGDPLNQPPTAVDDTASTTEDTPVAVNVTTNDTDPDDGVDVATVDLNPALAGVQTMFSTAEGMFTVDATGNVTFTPVGGFTGTAIATYVVSDTVGAISNEATITVTVTAKATPPTPDPADDDTKNSSSDTSDEDTGDTQQPALDVFDPAISKLGFLQPGQVGLQGEELEWIITVSNPSNVTGNNVVISDTIVPAMRVDNVTTDKGTVAVNGQTVTVNIGTMAPGEVVKISIFTTVLQGGTVNNTACVNGDNAAGEECATALPISSLPQTGETPWWRLPLLVLLIIGGFVLTMGTTFIVRRKRPF